jgi:hypothetical protein
LGIPRDIQLFLYSKQLVDINGGILDKFNGWVEFAPVSERFNWISCFQCVCVCVHVGGVVVLLSLILIDNLS